MSAIVLSLSSAAVRFDPKQEARMREVRKLLEYARLTFPIEVETADAFAARAANKLALVVGAP